MYDLFWNPLPFGGREARMTNDWKGRDGGIGGRLAFYALHSSFAHNVDISIFHSMYTT